MKRTILLLLLFALLLAGCSEAPPPELLDQETALTLALEEAKAYVPLGLQADSAVCELDEDQVLYRITFEPAPGGPGTPVTIVIDPFTGETLDVLLGE